MHGHWVLGMIRARTALKNVNSTSSPVFCMMFRLGNGSRMFGRRSGGGMFSVLGFPYFPLVFKGFDAAGE